MTAKYVLVSTSRTGNDSRVHNLLEIAVILLDQHYKPIDSKRWKVKHSSYVIDPVVLAAGGIHNISKHHAAAQSLTVVSAGLIPFLKQHKEFDKPLIATGFGIQKDLEFITKLLPVWNTFVHPYVVLDMQPIAFHCAICGLIPDFNGELYALAKHFKLEIPGGLVHCLDNARLAYKIIRRLNHLLRKFNANAEETKVAHTA